jgi:hypothetical protein
MSKPFLAAGAAVCVGCSMARPVTQPVPKQWLQFSFDPSQEHDFLVALIIFVPTFVARCDCCSRTRIARRSFADKRGVGGGRVGLRAPVVPSVRVGRPIDLDVLDLDAEIVGLKSLTSRARRSPRRTPSRICAISLLDVGRLSVVSQTSFDFESVFVMCSAAMRTISSPGTINSAFPQRAVHCSASEDRDLVPGSSYGSCPCRSRMCDGSPTAVTRTPHSGHKTSAVLGRAPNHDRAESEPGKLGSR